MLLVSTVVIWQSETKEESLPAMVQTEDVIKTDDYIELRIARDRHRSEARELLAQAIEAEEDKTVRREKQTALWESDKNRQAESEIETIIKARGFDDALVFCQSDSATVIVRTDSLMREEVIELSSLIERISGVKKEHILIRAKP
ncbi:MAG: SpoIIIAH-like family protein [Selenomonadales bacterium]|jgi:stage III sporulation protein AH|nr:SpoIIIAH-like family protein [Selenomonadales bacterium]MBQ5587597.1 SpoIIIAH-like family protein [Selenomonadales bacterium]MBQ5637149.1 SpoIIIAH-like family protein [Selenomonadales bacterium]